MEFRPLVEMTPSQLEPLVEMELNNYLDRVKKDTLEFKGDDATAKILDRWQTVRCIVTVPPSLQRRFVEQQDPTSSVFQTLHDAHYYAEP